MDTVDTQMNHSLEAIHSQLSSIKSALASLERDQETMKSEVARLHSCLRNRDLGKVVGMGQTQSIRLHSNSSFSITRFRLGMLFNRFPLEV